MVVLESGNAFPSANVFRAKPDSVSLENMYEPRVCSADQHKVVTNENLRGELIHDLVHAQDRKVEPVVGVKSLTNLIGMVFDFRCVEEVFQDLGL